MNKVSDSGRGKNLLVERVWVFGLVFLRRSVFKSKQSQLSPQHKSINIGRRATKKIEELFKVRKWQ